ncbi:SAM-dependent methyltransferase [Candidatus Venteria ishoeyi]|uniref:Methyltransferase type 11 domain-containing protein n=1 Tax=Candidatus Venteria ishoeyi TaxID=1899563 RepID=A0A1H6FFL6_9GAMM|nr:class I SAM-dependent methyltransferase [Candidatus Venteria ishoeyi]SEH08433.1 Uncharacterised protein [Candidatus Venteria ishoeyi]
MYQTLSFPLNIYATLLQLDNVPVKYLHFGIFQSADEDVYTAQQHSTEKVLAHLPDSPANILEIGLGLGTLQKILRKKGYQVQGMTPDKAQYDIALNHIGEQVDIYHLRFEDFTSDTLFDAIISQESSQYIDIVELLPKVNALLKIGGRFILIDEVSLQPQQAGAIPLHNPAHLRYFAQCMNFKVHFEEDLSLSAQYTMEYLQTKLEKYRDSILSLIDNNEAQLQALEKVTRHYIESYRNQSYGYRLMVFTKKAGAQKHIQYIKPIHFSEFQSLFQCCFEQHISSSLWQWKYQQNTAHSIGYWQNGQLIGHYGGFVRNICYFGQEQQAIQVGDTMVAHKARSNFTKNGIFHQLARIFQHNFIGFGAPYLLGFGFPNARVFVLAEKLGLYKEVGRMTRLLWSAKAMKPHLFYKIRPLTNDDQAVVDTLWQKMRKNSEDFIIGIRNWQRIQYRYLQHPEISYEVLKICHRISNKPLAVFILKKEIIGEKPHYHLIDFVCPLKEIPLVLRMAKYFSWKHNHSALFTLITENIRYLFMAYPFIETDPQITIPHSICSEKPTVSDVKNKWWLMAGDSDFM